MDEVAGRRYVKCDLISHPLLMRSKRLLGCLHHHGRPLAPSISHSANSTKWRRRITYRFAIRKNWSDSIHQMCWSELGTNALWSFVCKSRILGMGKRPSWGFMGRDWVSFSFLLYRDYYYYFLLFLSVTRRNPGPCARKADALPLSCNPSPCYLPFMSSE